MIMYRHASVSRAGVRPLTALVASAVIAGCGSFTAGGATGEARVVVSGDAPDPVPASLLATTPAAVAMPHTDHEDDSPEGQLEANFDLFLLREDGSAIQLTDDQIEVRIDLEGIEERQVANVVVPADRYAGFRISFSEFEVEVDAGLVINGQPVTGPIDVDFEDFTLDVDRPFTLEISEDGITELLIDLNSGTWLQAVDPATATVSASTVAAAIEIRERTTG